MTEVGVNLGMGVYLNEYGMEFWKTDIVQIHRQVRMKPLTGSVTSDIPKSLGVQLSNFSSLNAISQQFTILKL